MIEIRETPLTAANKRTLYRWGDDIFGVGSLDTTDLMWREFQTGFLLTVDGEPASYFRALRHVCLIDGSEVAVGGLGGLVTIPKFQGRGFGSRLVTATLYALRDIWKVDAALAFCLDHLRGFYQRLGAQLIHGDVMVDTKAGQRQAPFNTLCWPFKPGLFPITSVDLRSPLW